MLLLGTSYRKSPWWVLTAAWLLETNILLTGREAEFFTLDKGGDAQAEGAARMVSTGHRGSSGDQVPAAASPEATAEARASTAVTLKASELSLLGKRVYTYENLKTSDAGE